jgi:hypothetical protein
MTLDVVADELPGQVIERRAADYRSLSRAFELAEEELRQLRRQARGALSRGQSLEFSQDPIEDVLAAISRAQAELEAEG